MTAPLLSYIPDINRNVDLTATSCSHFFSWRRKKASIPRRRRRRIEEMVGPDRPEFVLFGSSIVQFGFGNEGWGAALADIYARKADIKVRGYCGWNSRRALQVIDKVFPKILFSKKIGGRLECLSEWIQKKIGQQRNRSTMTSRKEAPVQPSLVIVYFGGNDCIAPNPSGIGPHVPLPEYVENLRKIANHLKSLSDKTRLIFLSCPPINEEMLRQLKSEYLCEIVRTNETCQKYSEACINLCKEMDLKVIDLWTAITKHTDWANACFTDGIHFTSEGSKIIVQEILKVLKEAEWEPSLHWKSLPTEFAEDSPFDIVAADGISTINPSEWTIHWKIQWE